ncbi:hypothetical protein FQN49_005293 [Arthroderma sp. PD_2]|nr:hypothetical protein FQN49_005293 [Arthroderma sp. PD_2]
MAKIGADKRYYSERHGQSRQHRYRHCRIIRVLKRILTHLFRKKENGIIIVEETTQPGPENPPTTTLSPHLEAQTLDYIALPKNPLQLSYNIPQPTADMDAEAEAPQASEHPEPSDISTNDPPFSWTASIPPKTESEPTYELEYVSEADSDSIDFFLDNGDIYAEPFNQSFMSVSSSELVYDLDEGKIMPLLVAAYDMLFPNALEKGIGDGTISLVEDSSVDEYYDDDSHILVGESQLDDPNATGMMNKGDDPERFKEPPGAREKKRFVDGIFTWMKLVPGTDEGELAISSSENLSEKGTVPLDCDLKRKLGISDLHLAFESSDEGLSA